MPEEMWLKDKFIKYYFAKHLRITPQEYEDMNFDDADMIFLISNEFAKKDAEEIRVNENKARAKAGLRRT
jgi:hypothetical protein